MYDPDKRGDVLRQTQFLVLGLWHVFKSTQVAIWRYCSTWFFGPLFHTLFPNVKFPWSPRHKFLTWLLSLLRLSYPDVKLQLDNALNDHALPKANLDNLINLRLIFEYFVPVVIHYRFISLGSRFWIHHTAS